jgi:hypothetical protein
VRFSRWAWNVSWGMSDRGSWTDDVDCVPRLRGKNPGGGGRGRLGEKPNPGGGGGGTLTPGASRNPGGGGGGGTPGGSEKPGGGGNGGMGGIPNMPGGGG